MTETVTVGTYTLDEDTEFTVRYETASWWTKIVVPAGVYDVKGQLQSDGTIKDFPGVRAALVGTVVENHTPSSYGGVQYGSANSDYGKGKPKNHSVGGYAHALAKQLLEGKPNRFVLNDDFEAVEHRFTSTLDERQLRTYKVRKVEA